MERYTKESGDKIRSMERVNIHGQMAIDIKDNTS
jgi:hypothetical protein